MIRAYQRRKLWEAKVFAAQIMSGLSGALGGKQSSTGGTSGNRVSADTMLRNIGAS